jgi:hypothetical protein
LGVLAVSPQIVMEGDSVTISANVTNDGGSAGIFEALLSLDGAEVDNKEISINAGETETVLFTISADAPGLHEIALNELTGSFSIFANPEFANLVISPAEARIGEEVSVSVDIINSGQIPAEYAVCLEIDGAEALWRRISVAGGETVCPDFAVTKNEAGTYSVVIGNLSGLLTILSPAGFELGNLVISPEEAVAGWPASIMCDVTNTGGAEGCCSVALTVSGKEVETQEVTLSGGATETVAFSLVEDVGGSYAIAVGNLTGTLTVREGVLPTLHIGDKWVYRDIIDAIAYTVTETVVGDELMEDVDCYIAEREYDPALAGVTTETFWIEKTTQDAIRMQCSLEVSGVTVTGSMVVESEYTGDERWPLEVGSEWTETATITNTFEAYGQTEKETFEYTIDYRVEEIEEVTVGAGTFRCFKVVSSELGQDTAVYWYSDKAKASVKIEDLEAGESKRLLSYSVR